MDFDWQEALTDETLDPDDWESFRTLGHEMIDDIIDHWANVRERPVWQPIPDKVKTFLDRPAPRRPQGEEKTYQDFKEYILPHPMGNSHPRFWGWVMGNGIPFAVLSEMLAAGMNPNMGGGEHVPNYVERQVVDWCKEIVGFPKNSSGLLVSGGSMANFVGLLVARNVKAGFDIRKEGVAAIPKRLTMYGSTEMHSSLKKAADFLGLGFDALRHIQVNNEYQIDVAVLEQKLAEDKQAGFHPVCIVGNAGTVNTGAIDPLNQLADICEREGMWFHVDGAFGAVAALPDSLRPLVAGIERADSTCFDLHKWLYMPFEAACILIQNFDDHIDSFATSADYLAHMPRGVAGGDHTWFGDLGLQLTRGFRALKIWMTFKAYGLDKFSHQIERNTAHAQYLKGLVEETQELELIAPVSLNIVCFRFAVEGKKDEEMNDLNKEILMRLHEQGVAVPSYTTLNGKFGLRAAITNHRSQKEDFDFMIQKVLEFAQEILNN